LPQLPSKDINTQLDFIAGDGQWRSDAEYAAHSGELHDVHAQAKVHATPRARCPMWCACPAGKSCRTCPFVIFEIGDIKAEGLSGEIERALLVLPHAQRIAARWPGLGSPR
jgi:hypothetical protein